MNNTSNFFLKRIAERRLSRLEANNKDKIAAYEINKLSEAEKPFAYGICAYKLFWLFVIGSILGFIFETIWCFITTGRFEMRTSLVIGMFIPIYGFGAIAMTLCLHKLYKSRELWIFLSSAVVGGLVEYLCSLVQQIAFGTVSWDYSKTQYNIGGRTNLTYSLIWGVLGVIWLKDWYPKISKLIEKIPKKQGKVLTYTVLILLVMDVVLSGSSVIRKVERSDCKPVSNFYEVFLDKNFDDAYMNFVFPHMEVCPKHK